MCQLLTSTGTWQLPLAAFVSALITEETGPSFLSHLDSCFHALSQCYLFSSTTIQREQGRFSFPASKNPICYNISIEGAFHPVLSSTVGSWVSLTTEPMDGLVDGSIPTPTPSRLARKEMLSYFGSTRGDQVLASSFALQAKISRRGEYARDLLHSNP
ncbi:hypothetical protein N656DRAFT_776659 [Canariomyces notabilis]|uniref:Uncharacterized protein n=1 Tax=Canariomyces notabilis TaxID=2074819 RepID=A0AAN6TIH8_9PEZI|nr:hypothetical protein N656DRAFT_776659 [Canariomyces arenarius]